MEASPAALHRVLQNLPRDQTTPSSKTWHCLNFDSLLRLADADKAMLSGVARVKRATQISRAFTVRTAAMKAFFGRTCLMRVLAPKS